MKRFIFAVVWSIVLYFGACMLIGAIVGFQIGMRTPDPRAAAQEARRAAAEKVMALRPYLLGGALFVGIAGAALGILPGTRRPRQTEPWARRPGLDAYAVATGYPDVPEHRSYRPTLALEPVPPEEKRPERSKTVQTCAMVFGLVGITGFQVLAPTLFPRAPGTGLDLSQMLWAGLVGGGCAALGTVIGHIIESMRK
jgi:hypothetical protein